MEALAEEMKAKNADLEFVTFERTGEASTIEEFKRDFEHLFEED